MSRAAIQSMLQSAQRLHQAGKLPEAEAAYRKVLQRDPDDTTALHYLGLLAHQSGRGDVAIDLFRKSVSGKRTPPEFHLNFARALLASGDFAGAVDQAERAVRVRSGYAPAHTVLCAALSRLGRHDEAVAAGERAVGYGPQLADARNNLADAIYGLGVMRERQGRMADAINCFRRYTEMRPDDPSGFVNLGADLTDAGRFSEAIAACGRALWLQPDNVQALVNRGAALAAIGRHDEAIETFRRAGSTTILDAADRAHAGMAMSNLLLALHYDDRDPQAVFDEHVRVGETYRHLRREFPRGARDGDRIRVGYVSPDFRRHAVVHFIEPVIASHDRAPFEVFCYASSPVTDGVTRRLQGYDVRWRDITSLSDADAADVIARDGIDVLVDLAGHTGAYRTAMFAMKPAPVQVNYLGYPDTSGLAAMDYRITDAVADPPGMTERFHVERLVRLRTAWCYRPPDTAPPVGPPPSTRAGHVTFGSFNNVQKVTAPMLGLWAGIVASVLDARLILKAKGLTDAGNRDRIAAALTGGGLAPDRFELLERTPSIEGHLDLYNRIDVALDTYPYHGTTTTCEALWMGVPVVTLAGRTHQSRVGASLLTTVGLSELIADTPDAYATIATSFAGDQARLATLRETMRDRTSRAPLMDAAAFTHELEAAYIRMVEAARVLSPLPPGEG